MGFHRALGLVVLSLSLFACNKKVTVELPEAAPPPAEDAAVAADAAVDLDASVEAAAPLATATTTSTTAKVAQDTSGPWVAGQTWSGTYNCRGSSALNLRITSSSGNKIAAVFNFTSPKGEVGSFNQSGIYDPIARHLVLTAGSWIKQPPGFAPVNLDGHLDTSLHTFGGRVIGPGCSAFSVHH